MTGTGADSGKVTTFDGALTAPQPFEPRAKAWFATVTGAHTVPTWPVRVKVSAAPGRKLSPVPLHPNHVPAAPAAVARRANPAGAACAGPVIAAATVSATARVERPGAPVLVTTSRYVTTSPT